MSFDPVALQRANRQMVAERQALLAERDRLQSILNQRSATVAVEFVEGLGILVANARNGDQASKQVLALLAERLAEVRDLQSPLLLPNGAHIGGN